MAIEVKGLEEVQKMLTNFHGIDGKTKPLMQTIGNMLNNTIEDSFENETSPFGKKWTPLAAITKEFKEKQNKSSKILRGDGNLADRWVVKATNDSVTVSNNVRAKNGFHYGLTHQFGTNKAGRSRSVFIPTRPFLPIDKKGELPGQLQDDIKNETMNFLLTAIKK